MFIDILTVVSWFILWYLIILSLGYIVLLFASIPDIIRHYQELDVGNVISLVRSRALPPVTAIIPAFNEENTVLDTVYSILQSKYENINVIIVNDGSVDGTLNKLIDAFDLQKVPPIIVQDIKSSTKIKGYYVSATQKQVVVIDKEHSDKSDSANIGVDACRSPLFLTVDADTLLVEPEAISHIVFSALSVPHTVAVGGAVYILNGCEYKNGQFIEKKMSYNPICALQICEYLRSFLFSRSGWNVMGGTLCYSGAFTLLEKQAIDDIGGFDVGNWALDFEIITHLQAYGREHHYPYRIHYTPSAIAWTDVPSTLGEYWRQRTKWQKGSLASLMKYKRMCFNPKYGVVGLYTYPFFLFGEVLGAMVEFLAYLTLFFSWYLGVLDAYWALLFFIICWGFIAFLTMANVLMSFITYNKYNRLRDLLWIMVLIVLEQFGFRQFHVICRVVETVRYFFASLISSLKFW